MKKLLLFAFSLILYSNFAITQSAKLDRREAKVMKEIWGKLGLVEKKEWDFDKDPCSGEGKWFYSVYCDCSFESNTTCHVTEIIITLQNISTSLPTEFTKLRHLRFLDLSRNYFSGPIPSEWATMSLSNLSLMGNRLSGLFPATLTRMTTILDLSVEGNRFSGPIPKEIGNLKNLGKLRISDNNFTGEIPNYISHWTKIENLVLRNCLIHGLIPDYVGNLRRLQTLDLSFNNLTGYIPPSFSRLRNSKIIYLTENNLTGPIPGWILSSTNVDVSYNHFTWDASGPQKCEGTVNVVESYSSTTNKQNNIHPCLRKDFPCSKSNELLIYSLHINCGGEEVNINNIKYEADTEIQGASIYYNGGNWACSSTGKFLDDDHDSDAYIISNTSILHKISTSDTGLYTTARRAAISLTYYGLCLVNGNYAVRLHFAEIVFTQDSSSNILGKRVFNVYVQGELKLRDFDIVKEAGGTGRAVIKSYTVNVKNNTLKIQLYWAGKGTTGIPFRGSYGPIISAISVDPNFKPLDCGRRIEVDIIAGIVGGLSLLSIIIVFLWRKGYITSKKQHIVEGEMSHTTSFSENGNRWNYQTD